MTTKLNYSDILRAFNKGGVQYAIAGGFAIVAHGVVRVTMDLDLVVSLTPENLDLAWTELEELGFSVAQPLDKETFVDPEALKTLTKEKNVIAVSFFHRLQPYLVVDLLVSDELTLRESDVVTLELFGEECPVVSIAKLIEWKSKTKRPKDMEDLSELKKLQ